MRKGLDKMKFCHRKTMEVKFPVSGPAIGGAKSGPIRSNDPRKKGVLQRWYKVSPLLKVIMARWRLKCRRNT
jgi:hypothetical protein